MLPLSGAARLRVAGVAAENNYLCVTSGGHLQRLFPARQLLSEGGGGGGGGCKSRHRR